LIGQCGRLLTRCKSVKIRLQSGLHVIFRVLGLLPPLLLLLVQEQLREEHGMLSLVLFNAFVQGLVFLDLIIKHCGHLI
jgi:hypothetical protein